MPLTSKQKKPSWLKVKIDINDNYKYLTNMLKEQNLNTVCSEARCPNIYECWSRRTATIMILGDTCTRACGFCSVKTGRGLTVDKTEPLNTAVAVKKMNLKHVVITSVDRDDLKDDYGAEIWSATVFNTRSLNPDCTIEILTPDFKGYKPSLDKVFSSKPDIFSHNIECVERISKSVRAQAVWQRSKDVLNASVNYGLITKTGMMVGLGELDEEVYKTMYEMIELGVSIFNIGQYLQPTKKHLKVDRYVTPDQFLKFKEYGLSLGFKVVESGPLVRSSYMADKQAQEIEV
jgi:lipoic acid synthetase